MHNIHCSPRLFALPGVLCAILLACLTPEIHARSGSDESQEDKPAKNQAAGPVFDIETLKPVLQGTWGWKLPRKDASGTTDILVSFDDNARVISTARLVDGEGLVLSPDSKPATIFVIRDAVTNLKSPERGTILVLPLPGIQIKPARLLLKSVSQKKLECVDLADPDNPARANIVKTTDRWLHDIKGPASVAPAAAASSETGQPEATTAAATPTPERRPVMSVFQRLKQEQAAKSAEEKNSLQPPSPPPPTTFLHELQNPATTSTFQRLKEEQAARAAASTSATSAIPPASPYEVFQKADRRRAPSVYERLKAGQAEKRTKPQTEPVQDKQEPSGGMPPK